MKVNTMRLIDKIIGIPLTFLVTPIRKLFHYNRKKQYNKPNKILFIELSEMGSTILADPAMKKAKELYNAELYFLIFKKNKESLDILKTIKNSNIFTINSKNLLTLFIDTVNYLLWIRKHKIDTIIDLELFSRYTALLSGLSGAKNIVGFYNYYGEGLYRGDMLTHKIYYNPHHHISKNFYAMVQSLSETNLKNIDIMPKFYVKDKDIKVDKVEIDEKDISLVKSKIKQLYHSYSSEKIILINPNASLLLPQRCWSKSNYCKLISIILDRYKNIIVLVTGSGDEWQDAENIKKYVGNSNCINFAGQLPLSLMPTLYSISELMITNDSGPAHFAAVTNMPTIVLFGPETPKLYQSIGKTTSIYANLSCSPCVSATNHRKTPCKDNKCLQAINVDMVLDEVSKRLNDVKFI